MRKCRIVFMGTPAIACGMLDVLKDMEYDIVAVVTQPDKPQGRKKILQETPIKKRAKQYNLDVLSLVNIKDEFEEVIKYDPELIITCAYGQIIPKKLLEYPKYGCINLHASLLPKYRGGAPIHTAIINGEKQSGMTLMRMEEKMDAGAILAQEVVEIDIKDTTSILFDKLESAGKKLLVEKLELFLSGELKEIKQDEALVTFARNITKEQEFVSFNRDVIDVYNHIRGLISYPIGYGIIKNIKIKLHEVDYIVKEHNQPFGKLVSLDNDNLVIAAKKGFILISKLQQEGKKIISAKEYYNGAGKSLIGECFK
ncbi:MAG: methionyl-tRNA formyltransferase [Anaerorhabdus sp.]